MAVTADQAIFWYGCNMTRHGEVVGITARLLAAVGLDATPRGGPASCCGSPKDASARINEGMARRTIEAFNATGRETVVTWCPSCHMNMADSMAPVTAPAFETVHVSEVLHARREALRPLLVYPVHRRVMLHAHHGFNQRVPVNAMIPEILAMIPGLDLVASPLLVPGHMCSAIAAVPGALADAQVRTLAALRAAGADTLCTIFHSCHRESVPLERHGIQVVNWTHLLAESLGWPHEDTYKTLRNAASPRDAMAPGAMDAVGEAAFERLVEPELLKPATV